MDLKELEKKFNPGQLAAVCHNEGPMIVLAGPGSGKTTVITGRILYLSENCKVNPSNILVITFTKAAAVEMEERFNRLQKNAAQTGSGRVSFGTFHSVFFNILRRAYGFTAAQVIREEERQQVIKRRIGETGLDPEDEGDFIRQVLGEISRVKGDLLDIEHYYPVNCAKDIFRSLYQGYEKDLKQLGKIDFDDMLSMCYQLFNNRKDILKSWQKKYQYILIDEFQDINRLQYAITRMLALPENNLFIVGDDDQSIYRFRGAKPEIMLGFEKDYPDAARTLLDINYRSTQDIVAASGRLIRNNKKRFDKKLIAAAGRGKSVETTRYKEPLEQADHILAELRTYHDAGYGWDDMAVLFRTNLGPRLLAEKMMEYNIPFKVRDILPNIYEHWIAKNMTAYLELAAGVRNRSLLLSVMNRPNRYIGRDALSDPSGSLESVRSFYQDKEWMGERIDRLEYDLHIIGQLRPAAAVDYIRKTVGYNDYLKEYAEYRHISAEELYEVADQLQESAAQYKTTAEWKRHMAEYGKHLKKQLAPGEKPDGVSLMTMHSAKGLEFTIVYIPDTNEGVIPHHKAVVDTDVEEERRMFYVAMTRAKKYLHISWVETRYHKNEKPSRFIEEYSSLEQKSIV